MKINGIIMFFLAVTIVVLVTVGIRLMGNPQSDDITCNEIWKLTYFEMMKKTGKPMLSSIAADEAVTLAEERGICENTE